MKNCRDAEAIPLNGVLCAIDARARPNRAKTTSLHSRNLQQRVRRIAKARTVGENKAQSTPEKVPELQTVTWPQLGLAETPICRTNLEDKFRCELRTALITLRVIDLSKRPRAEIAIGIIVVY